MATQEKVTPRQLELARKALWHQDGEALRTMESARGWLEGAGLVPLYPHPQFQAPSPSFAEAVLGRPEQGWVPQPKRSASAAANGSAGVSSGSDVAADEEDFAGEAEEEDKDLNGTEEDIDEDGTDEEEDDDPEIANEDSLEEDDEEDDVDEEEEDDLADDADEGDLDDADADGADEDNVDDVDDDEEEDDDEPVTSQGDEAALAGDGNIPGDRETMLSDDDEFAEDEGDEIAEKDRIDAEGNPPPNGLRVAAEVPAAEPAPVPVNGFSPEERETVHRTLARLVEDGTVVPLNLLGSTTGEPDFVVPAAAFSFVYTLRGDKNWKNEPATTGAMRVSPLSVKAYATLKEKGAMPLHEITTELGQGITDSATLRALNELWAIQRVLPLPDADGRPARWEIMSERYLRHMKAGANAGQPTALSALLSLYLAQTVAATTDEMEIFLSPLAARSRVRDVVHGLEATRQLEPLVVEGKTLLHVTGALPQLPTDDTMASPSFAQRSRYESDDRRAEFEQRRTEGAGQPARPGKYPVRRPAGVPEERGGRTFASRPPRPAFGRGDRPASGGGDRPAFGRGDRPAFPRVNRPAGGSRPPFQGGPGDRERRPFQRRDAEGTGNTPDRSSFARPWDEERANRPAPTEGQGGERRPFVPRGDGERRPFTPREGGERRSFTPRSDGERRPFVPRDGAERRPFTPRGDGERRPFTPREGGERRPFVPRDGAERRPFTPRGDGERRPFTPREGGERRPFVPRDGAERRPFTPRGDGERRPFTPREGGERRPFVPRDGAERRPFTPREGGRGFSAPRGDGERRPFVPREGGERRPFVPRDGGDRRPFVPRGDGEHRPFTPREGSQDRPNRDRFQGVPGEGRPSFQSGAHSAGPGGSKFGGSGFGRDRGGKGAPGKFSRPGGRPSFKGPGSGPARGGAPKRRPE